MLIPTWARLGRAATEPSGPVRVSGGRPAGRLGSHRERTVATAEARPESQPVESQQQALDLVSIHETHADFLWLTLQRLGIDASDLEDVLQEVFVVVHKRLHTFDGTSTLKTWLYGIALRVAAGHRRKAHRRHETSVPDYTDHEGRAHPQPNPEELAAQKRAKQQLTEALDTMDIEKRAVFVMYELDELPCAEIASVLGVPMGTVHSRLYAARKEFEQALKRLRAQEQRRGAR